MYLKLLLGAVILIPTILAFFGGKVVLQLHDTSIDAD